MGARRISGVDVGLETGLALGVDADMGVGDIGAEGVEVGVSGDSGVDVATGVISTVGVARTAPERPFNKD